MGSYLPYLVYQIRVSVHSRSLPPFSSQVLFCTSYPSSVVARALATLRAFHAWFANNTHTNRITPHFPSGKWQDFFRYKRVGILCGFWNLSFPPIVSRKDGGWRNKAKTFPLCAGKDVWICRDLCCDGVIGTQLSAFFIPLGTHECIYERWSQGLS